MHVNVPSTAEQSQLQVGLISAAATATADNTCIVPYMRDDDVMVPKVQVMISVPLAWDCPLPSLCTLTFPQQWLLTCIRSAYSLNSIYTAVGYNHSARAH